MPAHQGAGAGRRAGSEAEPPPAHVGRERAWAEQERGSLQEAQVREMFERIAGLYDAMNSAMTAGMHHRWRARAAELAAVGPGDRVLDVATGGGSRAAIASAYSYLPSSVKRFPAPAALAEEMLTAGLCGVHYVLMAGGIVAIHVGTVPAGETGDAGEGGR